MIGSETFIMVALRCSENSTPRAFASAIWASMKRASAERRMLAASITSPACRGNASLSVLTVPSARSEEHTSELQSRENLVCRLLLEKKKEDETLTVQGRGGA